MPDCQEVNHIPSCVEGVDDPIIADAEPVAVAAGEMVVRKCAEPQSHFVDFGFDAGASAGWELEEHGVEARVKKLERRRPRHQSRLADEGLKAGCHFLFGFANGGFELRGELQPILDEIVEPVANLPQFGGRKLLQFTLNLLNFAHVGKMPCRWPDFKGILLTRRSAN